MSPHRSALLAARERLAALERERGVRRCEACASRRRGARKSLLAIAVMVGGAAIVAFFLAAPFLVLAATFDTSQIGR